MSTSNKTEEKPIPEYARKRKEAIATAREILRGSRDFTSDQLMGICVELEHYEQYSYAAEVLLIKLQMDEDQGINIALRNYHKLATYLYKDHSLPSSFKFKEALDELQSHANLDKTHLSVTLGLAGAIYKRKWMFDHQVKNLVLSRYYYCKGFGQWKLYLQEKMKGGNEGFDDDGYNGINFAFSDDLMAVDKLEESGKITGITTSIVEDLQEAESVRQFILDTLLVHGHENRQAWILSTIAEAYLGLKRYPEAIEYIQKYIARAKVEEPWYLKNFSQQVFSLAYLQQYQKRFADNRINRNNAGEDEKKFLQLTDKISEAALRDCLTALAGDTNGSPAFTEITKGGKQGIALSGGGFRASLFHIGVLAALAEKDGLRNIEVISCVSGGSIIGAYYYILLKELLESKPDDQITRRDYIELVRKIEEGFLKGVQKNLRVRVFSNLVSNFKMLLKKNYSRTHRLGELYEKHLYRGILKEKRDLYMNDLFINPAGVDPWNFDISKDNWHRRNKIPQLVLNATSVNTGHNWQFTASWMGEPPGNIQPDIDVKPRLRRMYYREAPGDYQRFRLGYAVGASSCVPVMFHPMPMYDLYPGIDLQLIDGGLHDNQGIGALIEQECSSMIISDASGQMPSTDKATGNPAGVFYRADSILQERLRELQFMDLKERNATAGLNQLITVHLKNDLQTSPVSWKFCIDPPRKIVYAPVLQDENELTKYGILRDVERSLSEVRTDLDSFNDTEAYALMYSGYMQTHFEWNKQDNEPSPARLEECWQFTSARSFTTIPVEAEKKKRILQMGSKQFLKLFYMDWLAKTTTIVLLLAIGAGLLYWVTRNWNGTIVDLSVKAVVFMLLVFIAGLIYKVLAIALDIQAFIRKKLILFSVAIVGWLATNVYLLFNPRYNAIGRVKRKDKAVVDAAVEQVKP